MTDNTAGPVLIQTTNTETLINDNNNTVPKKVNINAIDKAIEPYRVSAAQKKWAQDVGAYGD